MHTVHLNVLHLLGVCLSPSSTCRSCSKRHGTCPCRPLSCPPTTAAKQAAAAVSAQQSAVAPGVLHTAQSPTSQCCRSPPPAPARAATAATAAGVVLVLQHWTVAALAAPSLQSHCRHQHAPGQQQVQVHGRTSFHMQPQSMCPAHPSRHTLGPWLIPPKAPMLCTGPSVPCTLMLSCT